MSTIKITLTMAIAAVLATPAGIASWNAFGDSEPSTPYDDATFMWQDGPVASKDRVYFNGFVNEAAGIVSVGANPNVALLATHNEAVGIETYVAILGNWVDCNGDGYVGLQESALREYDAALLLDTSICPPSSGDINAWNGEHNYNGWVTELVPVGTNGGQPSASPGSTPDYEDDGLDQRIWRDETARVWGDYGKPDDGAAEGSGGTCPIRPFPRGTAQSTGGILDYADCSTGLLARWNSIWADELTVQDQTVPGPGDPLGLRFADEDDGHSGVLGSVETLGTEDSGRAAVVLTDCTAEPVFDSSATFNATNEQLDLVGDEDQAFIDENTRTKIYPAAPATRDTTDPTVPGQFNQTNEEFGGDCDTTNDAGHDTYGTVEGDFEGTSATDKRQSDFNMEFEDNGVLGCTPRGQVTDCGFFGVDSTPYPDQLHPGSAGAGFTNEVVFHDWFARVALVKGPPATTRGSVLGTVSGENPIGLADAPWITFYAYVGSNTTSTHGLKTPGGSGVYGKPQCGSFTSETHNGWNCDASLWNLNGDGTAQPQTQGGFAAPGALYNLRDADCFDGNNGLGVPLGAAALGNEPCP
ncbi:MAG TPA: hypothetical protein VM370_03155 [Candidatus Thermoplasmatota archaeon]|nr:hypothetical protein [Candidatus Thermoplasmatota archaeon]